MNWEVFLRFAASLLTIFSKINVSNALSLNVPQATSANSFRYFACPADNKCNACYASEDGGFSLQCSISDPFDIFSVNFTHRSNDSSLNIDCPCNQNFNFYDLIVKGPQTATIQTIRINNCPMPQGNLKLFFGQWMDAESLSDLSLHICPTPIGFEEDKFKGLWNITKLSLNQNDITFLPPLLFEDLTSLTRLRLDDNKLTSLSRSHFRNLKSLQLMQLGSNEIAEVEPDTFSELTALRQLNLEQNALQHLPTELFHSLVSLTVLDLSKNRISHLEEDQFIKNTQLKVLYMRENNLTSLPGGIFANNVLLKVLQLQSNPQLSLIQKETFKNLESLEEVDLSSCALVDLDDELFSSLNNLQALYLSKNKLEVIKPSWFANLSKLNTLDISMNQITFIETNAFVGLRNLETLLVDNNKLLNLTSGVFQGLTALKRLSIRDNQLALIEEQSMEPLVELTDINLAGNLLSFKERLVHQDGWQQSPLLFNHKLETIDLSRNLISNLFLDWMTLFPSLSKLNLADNYFEWFSLNDLAGLGLVRSFDLDLRRNKIQTIEVKAESEVGIDRQTRNGFHSKILRLGNNPIKCDCGIFNFARYANRTFLNAPHWWEIDHSDVICEFPPSLAGIPVVSASPDQFTCACQGDYRPCECKKRPFDKTILFKCGGRNMTNIPSRLPESFPGYRMHLDLSSNPLDFALADDAALGLSKLVTHLNLSRCDLDFSNFEAPDWLRQQTRFPNLQVLDLSENELTSVPKTVVSYWNSTSNMSLLLSGNPWSCDCSGRDLFEFVVGSYTRVRDFNRMTCRDGPYFSKMTLDDICPTSNAVFVNATLTLCAMAIIFVVVFVTVYRSRRTLKVWLYNRGLCISFVAQEEQDDAERLYDAFISFSHLDEDFVIQELVPQLEQPAPGLPSYRLCLHYRDWLAGEWIPDQISRSVASSKRTIVVLSENFLESLWGKLEFRTAYEQVLKDKCMRLIIIVKGDLPPKSKMDEELQKYLSLNTYLKWNDPWFWDRLRYALPHKKVEQSPGARISRAIRDHGDSLSKTEVMKPRHLPPLPLLTNRESLNKHVTLPRDIELSLTPISTTSSTAPVFPTK